MPTWYPLRPDGTVMREAAAWVSGIGAAQLIRGRRSAGIDTIGPLLEHAEDATIAVTSHRCQAWDYQSTLLAAVADAGSPLDDARDWYLP